MNRGHRNFKSADKCVMLARLRADETLRRQDTRRFGRSRPLRSHERLIATSIASTLVAAAFCARAHVARLFVNDTRYLPVGKVFSNSISVMIQGSSDDQLLVRMGDDGSQGTTHETILGGAMGQDTTAWTTIDGGGTDVDALLAGKARNKGYLRRRLSRLLPTSSGGVDRGHAASFFVFPHHERSMGRRA